MEMLSLTRSIVDIRFSAESSLGAGPVSLPLVTDWSSLGEDDPGIGPGWLIVLALRRCVGRAGHGIWVVGSGSASMVVGNDMIARLC